MSAFVEEFRELLQRGENLPTLPDVVFELHRALDDNLSSEADIAAIVETDPALTSRLLRVANSALLSHGDRISTVLGAVQRLGLRRVRVMCMALSVVQAFSSPIGNLDHVAFWTHSAAVGKLSQVLWRARRFPGTISPEDIYVAGLLHDTGLLVLDQFFNERFQALLEAAEHGEHSLWEVEDHVLGIDHGEIGGLLLGCWSLPDEIVASVAAHHHPEQAAQGFQDACRVIQAADIVCSAHGLGIQVEGLEGVHAGQALQAIGLTVPEIEDIFGQMESIAGGAGDLLRAA